MSSWIPVAIRSIRMVRFIHNEEVVKDMESKGVVVLRSEEELDRLSGGTVIIRSHGVEKRICDKLSAKGIRAL